MTDPIGDDAIGTECDAGHNVWVRPGPPLMVAMRGHDHGPRRLMSGWVDQPTSKPFCPLCGSDVLLDESA